MLSSLFLSFREGLEAALVVGIILTYLVQSGKHKLSKFVYWGVLGGLIVSVIGGYIGFNEAKELEETGEELFEGIMMLVSAGLIAYFVVWMSNHNKNISASIKSNVDKNSTGIGLLILSFLSVVREGIELITFIFTKLSENSADIALGTGIGLILAVIVGYLIFKSSVKFNLKLIFKILGIILIFIGAELFGEALAKFIPSFGEPLEEIGSFLFGGLSMLYFLKDDIFKIFRRI